LDQDEALVAAEEFGRRQLSQWRDWELYVFVCPDIEIDGAHVIGFTSKKVRFGGAFPIVVDAESGECRFIEGVAEYAALRKRTSEARAAAADRPA